LQNSIASCLRSVPIASVGRNRRSAETAVFAERFGARPPFDHLGQDRMQTTDRPRATGDELMMPTRQQTQDLPVILNRDNTKITVS